MTVVVQSGVLRSAGGGAAYAVNFDGTNDYMTHSSALTGIADGKEGTVSFWFKVKGGDGVHMNVFRIGSGVGNTQVGVQRIASNQMRFQMRDYLITDILDINTTATFVNGMGWAHCMAAWSLGSGPAYYLYINNSSDITTVTALDSTIAYSQNVTETNFGSGLAGSSPINMDIYDFWFDTSFLDLTVSGNRQKFISGGAPVSLGSTGQTPTGSSPKVFFRGPSSSFSTNLGTGGSFTLTGALTAASSDPP